MKTRGRVRVAVEPSSVKVAKVSPPQSKLTKPLVGEKEPIGVIDPLTLPCNIIPVNVSPFAALIVTTRTKMQKCCEASTIHMAIYTN